MCEVKTIKKKQKKKNCLLHEYKSEHRDREYSIWTNWDNYSNIPFNKRTTQRYILHEAFVAEKYPYSWILSEFFTLMVQDTANDQHQRYNLSKSSSLSSGVTHRPCLIYWTTRSTQDTFT